MSEIVRLPFENGAVALQHYWLQGPPTNQNGLLAIIEGKKWEDCLSGNNFLWKTRHWRGEGGNRWLTVQGRFPSLNNEREHRSFWLGGGLVLVTGNAISQSSNAFHVAHFALEAGWLVFTPSYRKFQNKNWAFSLKRVDKRGGAVRLISLLGFQKPLTR